MTRVFIGVDVSQSKLDVHVRPTNLQRRFDNTEAGIAELVAWVRPDGAERIVCESTGPYQKPVVGALLAEGLPAVVVNARQVRDFAKGLGRLAKTDVVDAAIIAHFAEIRRKLRLKKTLDTQHMLEECSRRSWRTCFWTT